MKRDKWIHGAIPALMIHGCIGTVYCWSMLVEALSERIGTGYEWAFSLAIFFLGMSAAFLGPFVERDVRRASLCSALLFGVGMVLSGVACYVGSRALLFVGYGVVMGISLGLGYLSPVKTLILWFRENKGLATGLAISGFGLAKVIATPSFEYVLNNYGITVMFISHGVLYSLIMLLGSRMLRKPEGTEAKRTGSFSFEEWAARMKEVIKLPNLWLYWVIFYINISAGLAIISHEKALFNAVGFEKYVSVALIFCAVFNTLGRLCVSWGSDYMRDRWRAFVVILWVSVLSCAVAAGGYAVAVGGWSMAVLAAVLLCNGGYGAMFATMPSALSDRYGVDKLSEVHGIILSAWAFAGLTGNQFARAMVILREGSTDYILPAAGLLYAAALILAIRKRFDSTDIAKVR